MGSEDVRRALEAMVADDEVATALAAGDLAVVPGLELTADEEVLVRDAAADLPDVVGFGLGLGLDGPSSFTVKQKIQDKEGVPPSLGRFGDALDYARGVGMPRGLGGAGRILPGPGA